MASWIVTVMEQHCQTHLIIIMDMKCIMCFTFNFACVNSALWFWLITSVVESPTLMHAWNSSCLTFSLLTNCCFYCDYQKVHEQLISSCYSVKNALLSIDSCKSASLVLYALLKTRYRHPRRSCTVLYTFVYVLNALLLKQVVRLKSGQFVRNFNSVIDPPVVSIPTLHAMRQGT